MTGGTLMDEELTDGVWIEGCSMERTAVVGSIEGTADAGATSECLFHG